AMRVSGTISVPAMRSPATPISSASSRVAMRLDDRVLRQRTRAIVETLVIDDCVRRDGNVAAVGLGRCRAHGAQRGVGAERDEGFHFGAARAADTPRLLEHARQ